MILDDNKLKKASNVGYKRLIKERNIYLDVKYFIDDDGNRYQNYDVLKDDYYKQAGC